MEALGEIAAGIEGDIPEVFWHGMAYERLITLWAGPSGVGKSAILARKVADATAAGTPVLYCPEEDKVMLRFKLEAAGADLSRVSIARGVKLPRDMAKLRFTIQKLKLTHQADTALVVFDTAKKHLSGAMQNWDDVLSQLEVEVLEATNCACDIIHHTNKNARLSDDWRAAIAGATGGLTGSARMIHLCGPWESDLLACTVKNSYARGQEEMTGTRFTWNDTQLADSKGDMVDAGYVSKSEGGIKVDNPLKLVVIKGDEQKKGPTPEQLLAAMEFLTLALADGPACMGDRVVCIGPADCGSFHIKEEGSCPVCAGDTRTILGLKVRLEDAGISTMTYKRAREALELVGSRKMSQLPHDKGGQGSIPWMRLPMAGDVLSDGTTMTTDHANLNPGAARELH